MKFNYDLNSSDRGPGFSIPENDIIDADKANAALGKITYAATIIKAVPLIIIGTLIILFNLLVNGLSSSQTKNCTVEAEGYVVSFDEWVTTDDDDNGSRTSYAPVVKFTAEDGKEYTSTYSHYQSTPICAEGVKINILYDPDDPSKIALPDFEKNKPLRDLLFMLPGIILLIAGLSMLKKAKRLKGEQL